MSCKYCEHESMSYVHHKDEQGRDVYTRIAEPFEYDELGSDMDVDPVLSWWHEPDVIDWADHLPRLCITAYDQDGNEECISIPVRHCPACGRKLPKTTEANS